MLTMTNPLTIEGYTVYQDDGNDIQAVLNRGAPQQPGAVARFWVLPDKPTIAMENGNPVFSLIVYRRDEDRIDPTKSDDVGGGILTFTIELAVPDDAMRRIQSHLQALTFGDSANDPSRRVDVHPVQFLDGTVSVAVAGETGAATDPDHEFVKGVVGTGAISGVGDNRKAVMVKLTQSGGALMSQLEKLHTLPINVQYNLSFEHRLVGVSMRVWCDVSSSYTLAQTVTHSTDDFNDGYLGVSHNHVSIDKITSVTETMVRNKTAGVTVIPATSQVDADTLSSLEKLGFDLLNKEMQEVLQAAPPPKELDRTYIEQYSSEFQNDFNFSLDRTMVLVQKFTPSANVSSVFTQGNFDELVAFVDLRTGFFRFLKIPVRVDADFTKLPLDSVTVTIDLQRERLDGAGLEDRVESFNFTAGSQLETFAAYANTLDKLTYDWSATAFYKGSSDTYTIKKTKVKDEALVVPVGQLGMIVVDVALGLADLDKYPKATVSFRYQSQALGKLVESELTLDADTQTARWADIIHEEPTSGYQYKVDWMRKQDGMILEGAWKSSHASQLSLDAPVVDHMDITVVCSGNFTDGAEPISVVEVSLHYEDPANHYVQDKSLPFTDDKQQQTWTVDLRNPDKRDYKYKYSVIYKGGVVRNVPEDGSWLDGQPGFITVGERYTIEVEIYPMLQSYPDYAKVVQVDLTYDDPAARIHQSDSFVFNQDDSTIKTWRVRGRQDGPKTYSYVISYFAATGAVTKLSPVTQEAEAIVLPPPSPPPVPAGPTLVTPGAPTG
jgi:hypothetical protein